MDRLVTPPNRITLPSWSPPPPCKQAFNLCNKLRDSPRWHLPKDSPSVSTSVLINVPMPDSVVDSQARHIKEKLDSKSISERN